MAVTATIQGHCRKVTGRNIAPGVQFSLVATIPLPAKRDLSLPSQTGLFGADMAALRLWFEVKEHHGARGLPSVLGSDGLMHRNKDAIDACDLVDYARRSVG